MHNTSKMTNDGAPKMERRHLNYIAEIIQDMEISAKQRHKVAVIFACKLAKTNARFKYDRFIERATAKPMVTI